MVLGVKECALAGPGSRQATAAARRPIQLPTGERRGTSTRSGRHVTGVLGATTTDAGLDGAAPSPGKTPAAPPGTGRMLAPGAGRLISGGGLHATLKVAGGSGALTSTFEIRVPPGFDVGAHVHTTGEELFYVVSGELDLLAFEPTDRREGDWHAWTSSSGQQVMRGGPGALLFVPAGCPHAFSNSGTEPATMLFQSAPSGHEDYFDELVELLQESAGNPDVQQVAELRRRHDIEQLTGLRRRG